MSTDMIKEQMKNKVKSSNKEYFELKFTKEELELISNHLYQYGEKEGWEERRKILHYIEKFSGVRAEDL